MKPTGPEIQDIVNQVHELTSAYLIWWEIGDAGKRDKYGAAIQGYPYFFLGVAGSLLLSICIIPHRLFDTDPRVISIPKLVKNLESTDSRLSSEISDKIRLNEGLLKKFVVLRNNFFAHRNASLTPERAFALANIAPGEMQTFLAFVQDVAATLSGVEGTNSKELMLETFQVFGVEAVQQTEEVIGHIVRSLSHSTND